MCAEDAERGFTPAPGTVAQLRLPGGPGLRVDVGFLHTLRDAIDFARRLGVGVCMEINACWAERGLADTIADGVDTIGIVQLSDFAVGTMSTPNRLVPGDGDIPMARMTSALRRLVSPNWLRMAPLSAAARAGARLRTSVTTASRSRVRPPPIAR